MADSAIIDAGPMIAIVARRDRWHRACAEALAGFRLPLITSEAVLTEAFYMTRIEPGGTEGIWKLLLKGVVAVASIDNSEMPEIEAIMSRYRDRCIDFADATLIYLARRESLSTIFTIDHNDFETYRIEGKRRFRIVPSRRM